MQLYSYNVLVNIMDQIEDIKKKLKNKKINIVNKKNSLLKSFLIKTLILILIGILILIFIKKDDKNKELISKYVFENNISFSYINNFYKKYLGNILPFDNLFDNTSQVFNEDLVYESINKYKDGISLKVASNYLIPCLESGIVTFMEKKRIMGKQ